MHKSFLVFMLLIDSLEIIFIWHLFIYFSKNFRCESLSFKVIKKHNIVVIILFPNGRNVALHSLLVILVDFLDALLYLVPAQRTRGIVTFISFCFSESSFSTPIILRFCFVSPLSSSTLIWSPLFENSATFTSLFENSALFF